MLSSNKRKKTRNAAIENQTPQAEKMHILLRLSQFPKEKVDFILRVVKVG